MPILRDGGRLCQQGVPYLRVRISENRECSAMGSYIAYPDHFFGLHTLACLATVPLQQCAFQDVLTVYL